MLGGAHLGGHGKVEEILRRLGKEFAVQKVVKCCDSLKKLHLESVNTFRVMTYIWKGEIVVAPAILRLGMGKAYLDNAHQGGVFIAVDSDGTLHKTAFTEFNRKFDVHPDSGIKFEGYKISQFPSVVAAAKKLHALIPQLGVINWDFTVNQSDEPVLIEANTQSGSIWLFQMAHGKGVFGDRTSEVLRWMRAVKKVPHSKWGDYAFGNIPEEK